MTPPKPPALHLLAPQDTTVASVSRVAASSASTKPAPVPNQSFPQSTTHTPIQATSIQQVPPPPLPQAHPAPQQIVAPKIPPPRPKSAYGRPIDTNSHATVTTADNIPSDPGRRVSVETTDQKICSNNIDQQTGGSQGRSSHPVSSTNAAATSASSSQSYATNTYPKRLPLHSLPTDLGNQDKHPLPSDSTMPAVGASLVASSVPVASFKRTNPYSQQNRYPNKNSRSSI
jgi:hypothetical protein